MEKIKWMSDVELTELLELIDEQLGQQPRRNDRLSFYTMVDYVVANQYYRDFIQDLSVSGVFIKARQMFEPGQHIMMTFMSPFLQKPFKISGEIVRTLDSGIGVNFDKQSQVQTEAISALMDQIRKIELAG
jgi:predicted sugar kinase